MDLPLPNVDLLTAMSVAAHVSPNTIICVHKFPDAWITDNNMIAYARVDCWMKYGWFTTTKDDISGALYTLREPSSEDDERDCLCNGDVHKIKTREKDL